MASRTLEITFVGNPKPLQEAMGKVESSSGSLTAKISGLSGAFSTVAGTAAGFLSANVIAKAPAFFMDAAQGAAEDAAATARLEQALKNLGGPFEQNLKLVNERIAAGQKLAFGDDAVRDSFQTLLAATGDVNEALGRQKLAMDLARGANIPLEQASKLLGKVTAENVEQFKRMGITIGEGASEAEAFAAIQAKFGGQADQYAKSTAGQFEILKLRLAEAKETIGAALLPAMTAVGDVLATKVVPAVEDFAGRVGPALGAAGAFLDEHLMPPLERLAEWFTNNASAMQAAGVAIGAVLVVAFLAWAVAAGAAAVATIAAAAPVILVVAAVALLAAGIFLLIKHWDDITAKFPILGQAADAIQAKFDAFAGWITGTFAPKALAIYDAVKAGVDKAVGYVTDHWDDIKKVIEPALKALGLIIETAWNQFKVYVETALGVIKGVVNVFMGVFTGDWGRAWDGVKQIFESLWNGLEGTVRNAFGLLTGLLPLILDIAGQLGGALKDGFVAGVKGTIGVIGNLKDALLDALKSLINSAIDAVNDSIPNSLTISVLGKDIGVDLPDNPIPKLAAGGIVTKPTLALIGEAGPEAVIPLSRGRLALQGGGVQVIQLVVDGAVLAEVVNRENERAY